MWLNLSRRPMAACVATSAPERRRETAALDASLGHQRQTSRWRSLQPKGCGLNEGVRAQTTESSRSRPAALEEPELLDWWLGRRSALALVCHRWPCSSCLARLEKQWTPLPSPTYFFQQTLSEWKKKEKEKKKAKEERDEQRMRELNRISPLAELCSRRIMETGGAGTGSHLRNPSSQPGKKRKRKKKKKKLSRSPSRLCLGRARGVPRPHRQLFCGAVKTGGMFLEITPYCLVGNLAITATSPSYLPVTGSMPGCCVELTQNGEVRAAHASVAHLASCCWHVESGHDSYQALAGSVYASCSGMQAHSGSSVRRMRRMCPYSLDMVCKISSSSSWSLRRTSSW